MGLEGGVSSLGVEGRNYGGGGEISVRNFRFVPQIFGGVISLSMIKITPPNGSCAQDAAGIGVADHCRHLLGGARRRRALARRRRAPTGSDQRHEECVEGCVMR